MNDSQERKTCHHTCPKCRLAAEYPWSVSECPWCRVSALEQQVERLTAKGGDDMLALAKAARRILHLRADVERLTKERDAAIEEGAYWLAQWHQDASEADCRERADAIVSDEHRDEIRNDIAAMLKATRG